VFISHLPHTNYIPRPSHPPWFDHPNNIWWSSSLCSLLQDPATSSLISPNILLSTLSQNTFNLCSSLSVRDQVSHPYKQQVIVLPFIL
jgi:hypothetical protein